MTVSLAMALVLLAAGDSTTEGRRPTKDWYGVGYQQLHWGMGPADVEDALKAGPDLKTTRRIRKTKGGRLSEYEAKLSAFKIMGCDVKTATLRFVDGALYEVRLLPSLPKVRDGWIFWADLMATPMRLKYGEPVVDTVGAYKIVRAWLGDGETVTVVALPGLGIISHSSADLNDQVTQAGTAIGDELKKL